MIEDLELEWQNDWISNLDLIIPESQSTPHLMGLLFQLPFLPV